MRALNCLQQGVPVAEPEVAGPEATAKASSHPEPEPSSAAAQSMADLKSLAFQARRQGLAVGKKVSPKKATAEHQTTTFAITKLDDHNVELQP